MENFDKKVKEILEFLQREFVGIRTGAASIAVLDPIKVEAYGSLMPINQLANISVQDATSLLIAPYDVSISGEIEKAIINSGTGLGVSNSGNSLIVSFPSLTAERRVMLIKLAKEKLEDARVSLRKLREEIKSDILKKEKDGDISEDDKFRQLEELDKKIKEVNEKFDEMYKMKEKEINE